MYNVASQHEGLTKQGGVFFCSMIVLCGIAVKVFMAMVETSRPLWIWGASPMVVFPIPTKWTFQMSGGFDSIVTSALIMGCPP